MQYLRPALVLIALFTALLGIAYPLAITGAAQALFPQQANGSLITRDGRVVGSALIGQTFTRPEYFWSRQSAAGGGYDASASSGSNLGPSSRALHNRIATEAARLREAGIEGAIPADLATASGSGLDPHISVAAAHAQASRVTAARGLSEDRVLALIRDHTTDRFLGVLGEPAVNVLTLNLALDALDEERS